MSIEKSFPRLLVIAVWFGPLPAWFPLWVTSCRFNRDVDWLLITNAQLPDVEIPDNIHVVHMSMQDFAQIIQSSAGVQLHFEKPYKACDYRPLFSCLTHLVPGHWDFWGHCDLDMLFGNMRDYVTPELLSKNDRIFGVGHFSLYRNNESTNNFYRRSHPAIDYKEIIADPRARGFDEHLGVNRIWRTHEGRFHEDESVIVDLDPQSPYLRRTSSRARPKNYRTQAFCFDEGKVVCVYQSQGALHKREFMYIHFQKRRFDLPMPIACERVWLTPQGFVPMADGQPTPELVRSLNPSPLFPTPADTVYRAKRAIRVLRQRIAGHQA